MSPLPVYLDQNAMSYLSNQAGWQTSDLGSLLLDPGVEVWVSPVHCLEIAQATDPGIRAALARTAEVSQRAMLTLLALLAQGRPPSDAAIGEILRGKFTTQALHAAAVRDPATWLRKLIDSAEKILVTEESPMAAFDAKSIEELREAVNEMTSGPGVPQKLREAMNKNRRRIAHAYGAVEIGSCIVAALPLPMDVDYTFVEKELGFGVE